MDPQQLGKTLLWVGLAIAAAGLFVMGAGHFGLGRLPGDIVIERKGFTFSFPIVTCIIVSVVLTLIFRLFRNRP